MRKTNRRVVDGGVERRRWGRSPGELDCERAHFFGEAFFAAFFFVDFFAAFGFLAAFFVLFFAAFGIVSWMSSQGTWIDARTVHGARRVQGKASYESLQRSAKTSSEACL